MSTPKTHKIHSRCSCITMVQDSTRLLMTSWELTHLLHYQCFPQPLRGGIQSMYSLTILFQYLQNFLKSSLVHSFLREHDTKVKLLRARMSIKQGCMLLHSQLCFELNSWTGVWSCNAVLNVWTRFTGTHFYFLIYFMLLLLIYLLGMGRTEYFFHFLKLLLQL